MGLKSNLREGEAGGGDTARQWVGEGGKEEGVRVNLKTVSADDGRSQARKWGEEAVWEKDSGFSLGHIKLEIKAGEMRKPELKEIHVPQCSLQHCL